MTRVTRARTKRRGRRRKRERYEQRYSYHRGHDGATHRGEVTLSGGSSADIVPVPPTLAQEKEKEEDNGKGESEEAAVPPLAPSATVPSLPSVSSTSSDEPQVAGLVKRCSPSIRLAHILHTL